VNLISLIFLESDITVSLTLTSTVVLIIFTIGTLNETFNTIRRDITDQISDIQRQLNGQMRTEMKVTSENYKRP
jgi:sensor domain CHASE-containing protein